MNAQDLYHQLIVNLEIAKETCNPMPPEIKTSLRSIGSFLRSRSTQFEVLENQEDISVFLSMCKSNRENLVLVFNYFLTDSLVIQNKKVTASKFLKTMLYDFDKAIKGFEDTGNQTKQRSGFKVISGLKSLQEVHPLKKSRGRNYINQFVYE